MCICTKGCSGALGSLLGMCRTIVVRNTSITHIRPRSTIYVNTRHDDHFNNVIRVTLRGNKATCTSFALYVKQGLTIILQVSCLVMGIQVQCSSATLTRGIAQNGTKHHGTLHYAMTLSGLCLDIILLWRYIGLLFGLGQGEIASTRGALWRQRIGTFGSLYTGRDLGRHKGAKSGHEFIFLCRLNVYLGNRLQGRCTHTSISGEHIGTSARARTIRRKRGQRRAGALRNGTNHHNSLRARHIRVRVYRRCALTYSNYTTTRGCNHHFINQKRYFKRHFIFAYHSGIIPAGSVFTIKRLQELFLRYRQVRGIGKGLWFVLCSHCSCFGKSTRVLCHLLGLLVRRVRGRCYLAINIFGMGHSFTYHERQVCRDQGNTCTIRHVRTIGTLQHVKRAGYCNFSFFCSRDFRDLYNSISFFCRFYVDHSLALGFVNVCLQVNLTYICGNFVR